MADATTRNWDNQELSAFIATFPTQLHCSKTKFYRHIWVFWSQSQRPQINPSWGVSDSWVIHEKIKSTLLNLYSSHINGLIQFWAPVESSGRRLLSTSNQPFVLENLDPDCFLKYRLCCQMYQYSVDDVSKEDPMIISGAPTTAFLSHLPQVVNLRVVNHGSPLVSSALECDLTTSLVLPVFYPASQTSDCVGVVEYCMKQSLSHLVEILNDLKRALEMVGLSMFPEKRCRPYKAICGLKLATYEIEEALQIVCDSLNLTLAQVWIAYENETRVPFASSLKETPRKQDKFAVKLIDYAGDDHLMEYFDTCNAFPLKIGEGLAGKTLQTHKPHFCRNINELRDNGLLALLPAASAECSCLVICLRSKDTGDVDYAFEFLWPQTRNHFILLESLLLALKTCLPSFNCGADFGDHELCVVDVGNSTENGNKTFKILNGNMLSQPFGTTRGHQTTISECQGQNFIKRELTSDLWDSEIESSQEDCIGNEEKSLSIKRLRLCEGNDKLMIIQAEYGDHHQTITYLPISSKLADIKKTIDEKFKLSPDSYKLQFLDFEDEWIMLNDEGDWKSCNLCLSTPCIPTIRLRVFSFTTGSIHENPSDSAEQMMNVEIEKDS